MAPSAWYSQTSRSPLTVLQPRPAPAGQMVILEGRAWAFVFLKAPQGDSDDQSALRIRDLTGSPALMLCPPLSASLWVCICQSNKLASDEGR